jgi:hypothetical protein
MPYRRMRGKRYEFVPFLYDDAAAALRKANNKYLDAAAVAYSRLIGARCPLSFSSRDAFHFAQSFDKKRADEAEGFACARVNWRLSWSVSGWPSLPQ